MIDPDDVTKYDRSEAQLEEWILFCCVVAGKTARVQAVALERFLQMEPASTAFESVRKMIVKGRLLDNLKASKLGQYGKLERTFRELATLGINLYTCTAEDLEAIHGIGFKTSRFFIVHSRKNQPYAILDTHILRFLREHEGIDTPKSTPSSLPLYRRLEQAFLECATRRGKTVADLDLAIWKAYSHKRELSLTA